MELYLPIHNYEHLYEISNFGNVRKILKNGRKKPVKHHKQPSGQLMVYLSKKGVKNSFSVPRMVFRAHAPQELFADGKEYDVILIDGDKKNCTISNLEWFEKQRKRVVPYSELSDCEKFAHDTKYVSYLENHWGYDYYVFQRTLDTVLYHEMWNIDVIEENLDYLRSKYQSFISQFNS